MKVPSESEIKSLESKLAEMRKARVAIKNDVLTAIKSEDFFHMLEPAEIASLMRKLQNYLRGTSKRNRGTPVPEELKTALVQTLMDQDRAPSLAQMAESYGLSVSYISKIRKALKEAGKLTMNAYTDRQLQHQA